MRRVLATLSLALVAVAGTLGGVAAQDATPMASPTASAGIPPIVWISNDYLPTASVGTPEEGAVALGSSYWVQFLPDGGFAFRADCNGGFGSYTIDGSNVTLGPLGTTLMLCPEGGQGDAFVQDLSQVTNWSIDQSEASDQLVLGLADGRSLTFAPSLSGVVWQWSETQMMDGTVITPNNPENYYLSFNDDGSVVGQIDCNRAAGSYETDGNQITMMLATTKMYCGDDSQDTAYALALAQVTSFVIRDGKLALAMPMDSGIVIYTPIVQG